MAVVIVKMLTGWVPDKEYLARVRLFCIWYGHRVVRQAGSLITCSSIDWINTILDWIITVRRK